MQQRASKPSANAPLPKEFPAGARASSAVELTALLRGKSASAPHANCVGRHMCTDANLGNFIFLTAT